MFVNKTEALTDNPDIYASGPQEPYRMCKKACSVFMQSWRKTLHIMYQVGTELIICSVSLTP